MIKGNKTSYAFKSFEGKFLFQALSFWYYQDKAYFLIGNFQVLILSVWYAKEVAKNTSLLHLYTCMYANLFWNFLVMFPLIFILGYCSQISKWVNRWGIKKGIQKWSKEWCLVIHYQRTEAAGEQATKSGRYNKNFRGF